MNDYKNTASLYDALLPIRFEEIRFYRKYCKKGYSVLEVGCGTGNILLNFCLLYTSPSPRDRTRSRMPSSA